MDMVPNDRVESLIKYVNGVRNDENGRELYLKYKEDIEEVKPQEVFEVFYRLYAGGVRADEILDFLDKVLNVFYKSLNSYKWKRPAQNGFLDYLMRENSALKARLDSISQILKDRGFEGAKKELSVKVRELQEFDHHYLKKENILFPFLEKKMKKFEGLAIMWALHDAARERIGKVISCLEDDGCTAGEFNAAVGALFFAMHGLIKKEELILFPAASEVISDDEWNEMQRQSLEYKFPFIEKPKGRPAANNDTVLPAIEEGYGFKTETGVLSFEDILLIFNALPVDLTFVDENNKVKFFTRPKDRIFPRSPAIIGRDVEKCHPPESVHKVREIIEAFRSGKQDNAAFWIKLKGKMILIQYFALRDKSGFYKGTLEVSQDITGIKSLEGERRLLNWENNVE